MTPRTKATAKAAVSIADDDDRIEVLVSSGETLLVNRKTLMLRCDRSSDFLPDRSR